MMSSENKRFGKFFFIRHKSEPNLVIEVQNGSKDPGTAVVIGEYELLHSELFEHQLWYVNRVSHTICSKLTGFCMQLTDDSEVVVNPIIPGSDRHRWNIDGEWIRHESPAGLSLGVVDNVINVGAKCQAADSVQNQCWIIDYQHPYYMYIKPQSNTQQVLDVRRAENKPGAKVIVYTNKGDLANNQLWYEDENGILRSKLNTFALDATGKEIVILPYDRENAHQQWVIHNGMMCNVIKPTRVLNLKIGMLFSDPCLTAVDMTPPPAGMLHLWSFEYIPHQAASLNHSGCGKYFVICNQANELVLQVDGRLIEPGTQVTLAVKEKNSQRQYFCEDILTGTIRSQLRNYCLDVADNGSLVINPFDPYRKMQQWVVSSKKIQNRHDLSLVLQALDDNPGQGSHVTTGAYTANEKQHWDINHMMARCFYVKSQWNHKVLDIRGDEASAGASLIVYDRKPVPSANQLWYEDEKGLLRSKLNGYVIDTSAGAATLRPYDPTNKKQHWIIVGDRIQNKYDSQMVLDIYGKSPLSVTVGEYRFHGGENQRWTFEMI